jgi:hypothetical protein
LRNGKSLPPAVPEKTSNMKEPISQRVTDLAISNYKENIF